MKVEWDRPPIGIMPEYIWKQQRYLALWETIKRYTEAGYIPKPEWIEEFHRLAKEETKRLIIKEEEK